MALFDYKCDDCDYTAYDVFYKEGDVVTCPTCGKEMRKCFGNVAIKVNGYCYKNAYSKDGTPTLKQMGLKK